MSLTKIERIKDYRALHSVSLREACDAVNADHDRNAPLFKVVSGHGRFDYIPQDENPNAATVIAHKMTEGEAKRLTTLLNAYSPHRRS